MLSPRLPALVLISTRRGSSLMTHAKLYTTRPVAADFASYGKIATPGANIGNIERITATDQNYTYTKQQDVTPEPRVSHTGTRTYVVSPKDNTAPYDVPGGAYGTSDPYLTPPKTPAPQTSAPSSTFSSLYHPNTTSRVPHYPDGVGESATVRFRTAPGAMHTGDASDDGIGFMGTSKPQTPKDTAHPLADRNLPLTDGVGRAGNSEAWKHRK